MDAPRGAAEGTGNPFWTLTVVTDEGETITQPIYPNDADTALQRVGQHGLIYSTQAGYVLVPAHRIRSATCLMP